MYIKFSYHFQWKKKKQVDDNMNKKCCFHWVLQIFSTAGLQSLQK